MRAQFPRGDKELTICRRCISTLSSQNYYNFSFNIMAFKKICRRGSNVTSRRKAFRMQFQVLKNSTLWIAVSF